LACPRHQAAAKFFFRYGRQNSHALSLWQGRSI
jgi:hypothetical protein